MIDLFEEYAWKDEQGRQCGLEGPLWSYHGGLHTEDDDPAYYWQPYVLPFYDLIRGLEGMGTAKRAAISVQAFTGHFSRPDARLAEVAPEAFLEQDGETLKRDRIPRSGEIEPTTNEIFPAQQAQVGPDAWRQEQQDLLMLEQATAVDQASNASGNAMIVGETLAKVAQRHTRDGALDALVSAGEKHLRILEAIYQCYGIRWPLQTVGKKPVGHTIKTGRVISEYDPGWIGDGNYILMAEYPEEENLARIDLERSLYKDGVGTFDAVQKARGESDTLAVRKDVAKDRLWNQPSTDLMLQKQVAQQSGNRQLMEIVRLQEAQLMSQAQISGPGEGGIPAAALRRQGEQMGGGGYTGSSASSIRGGIQAGQVGTATAQANAENALTRTGTAA